MRYNLIATAVLVLLVLIITMEPAIAGPGGTIARAVFETWWGKVVFGVLVIFFLPFIVLIQFREWRASHRARQDLAYMARISPDFDWLKICHRTLSCFSRIHAAWSREDISEAAEFMTSWYWQNQQKVYLDRWEHEGLINHCRVKKVQNIKPILFSHRNESGPHEGSMLILSIIAHAQDYLARRTTGEVVEGSKKWKDVETIWTLTLDEGRWRVSNIEEALMSYEYAKLVPDLPKIEDTVLEEKPSA
jgi:hypothetical protein